MKNELGKLYKIAIKIALKRTRLKHINGDYHFALGLKHAFERKGHSVIIQNLPEWNNGEDLSCDIIIVLRGFQCYYPKKDHLNILWNISHPDRVSIKEYNQYDYVLISSEEWTNQIRSKISVPVEVMHQCTDPELFKPHQDQIEEFYHELLFVGNTRGIFRQIIKDLLPTDKNLAVYGKGWSRYISPKYRKGMSISNHDLYKYYSSCEILLNDHYKDMRQKGFINNRIFDGLASEAFIISDDVHGIEKILEDTVVTYKTPQELKELIEYYLKRPDLRKSIAAKGGSIVKSEHTFAHRVDRFLQIFAEIYADN